MVEEEFSQYFRAAQPKFQRLFTLLVSKANITIPQYFLLSELNLNKAPMSMTEVSGKLHITKAAVTSLTDKLERLKYLKRIPHQKDRRVYLLQISGKGKKTVHHLQQQIIDVLLDNLKPFSADEKGVVTCFYASLSANLDRRIDSCTKSLKKE